jgi:hypothetical protein
MFLLFPLLFIANLIVVFVPVKEWPPFGRWCLLFMDIVLAVGLFLGAQKPPEYSEWGMGGLHQEVFPIAGVLLCLSALPLAKQCFFRPRR